MRKHTLCSGLVVSLSLALTGCVSLDTDHVVQSPASKGAAQTPDRESLRVSLAMAGTLENTGQELEAIRLYEQARLTDPARVAHRLALLYDRVGQFDKAEREFEQALKQAPSDAELLTDLGVSLLQRGKLADAERNLRSAIQQNDKNVRASFQLGVTLDKQGKIEEAKVAYRATLATDQNHRAARTALARLEPPTPIHPADRPTLPPQRLEQMDELLSAPARD
jgi:Tfp pilus assembly protein PilF